jgi:hypothetical protein
VSCREKCIPEPLYVKIASTGPCVRVSPVMTPVGPVVTSLHERRDLTVGIARLCLNVGDAWRTSVDQTLGQRVRSSRAVRLVATNSVQ